MPQFMEVGRDCLRAERSIERRGVCSRAFLYAKGLPARGREHGPRQAARVSAGGP
jgi:hypothetical protein